ncbi:RAMP superfamily CRISPR-associated protein [Mangrovihabitans endophyticus]|uniref:CRISPR type III-associated protein domain-containing protein n=1 Tax=Mangrovihabitans endophyticus TaxID=1751298 RepID=A0A8J3C3S5_9ACTN|nr:RAMP superfamily CRISPR-associated protein [Mangrovihabitans endophyticus]GGL05139.1 hypothetical protein GCM10012284_44590 [Mangrovihabitans endophyticus]
MKLTLVHIALTLRTDGAVAAPETTDQNTAPTDPEADRNRLPAARDGHGRLHTPGTSLAGLLRAHLGEHSTALLGPPPDTKSLTTSPLRILGTTTTPPTIDGTTAGTIWRGQTAVDRRRAAPAVTTLRTAELLPAGTTIDLYLRLDHPDAHWPALAEHLTTWQPQIGRGHTTGRGHTDTTTIRYGTLDLDQPDDLHTWLTRGGPDLVRHVATTDLTVTPEPNATITVDFHVHGELHVGTGDKPAGTTPALRDGHRRPIIPGTTWKGILRARATWILAHLGITTCATDHQCGTCPTCRLFGYTAPPSKTGATGRRGHVTFADSPLRQPGNTRPARPVPHTHVAIDRVTGGAHDGLLYTLETFPAAHTTLTIGCPKPLEPWMRALLLLALRDLHDGYLGVGANTTRGYGTLRATDPKALTPTTDQLAALAALTPTGQP